MATIHPYKGYLNTEFQLFSRNNEPVSFVIIRSDDSSNKIEGTLEPNVPQRLRMSHSGKHNIHFDDNSEAEFIVEEGYKLGGGHFKNAFVFDNCPWGFVVMHDRTYFHNRETGEEYVEFISPDTIIEVSQDYVLFKNNGQQEVTLYSLHDQKPVICASDILYHNPCFLVWSESHDDNQSKDIIVYSINKKSILIRDSYSHISIDTQNGRIYYVNNNQVQSINLSSDENFTHEPLIIKGTFAAFAQTVYAVFIEASHSRKNLVVYNLDTREERGRIMVSGHISRLNDAIFIDIHERHRSIHTFDLKVSGFPEAIISAEYIEFDIYPCEEDVFYKETHLKVSSEAYGFQENSVLKSTSTELLEAINSCQHAVLTDGFFCIYGASESVVIPLRYRHRLCHKESGRIHSYQNMLVLEEDNSFTQLNQHGFWQTRIEQKGDFRLYEDYGIILDKDSQEIANNRTLGKFITRNQQKGYVRTNNAFIRSDGTVLRTQNIEEIPSNLSPKFRFGIDLINNEVYISQFMGKYSGYTRRKILSESFDASSYANVLFCEDGHKILYQNNKVFTLFDVDTAEITEFDNLHFVRHINGSRPLFRLDQHRQAILINPVTGLRIDFDLISNYKFISPNGELYADNKLEQYIEYYNRISKEVVKSQEYNELSELLDFPTFNWTSREDHDMKKEEALKARKDFISEHQDYFDELPEESKRGLLTIPLFVNVFVIEKRGVALIRKINTKEVYRKIPLGPPLKYINYAAFSYDNRYVAIAGCYPLGAGGGLYLIYDLIKQVVICQTTTSKAVWTAAFTKGGAIAAYTSDPISFFASSEGSYSESIRNENIINGYNFLSFSPDGKYFACSQQGYISYRKANGETRANWGHQPSSLVSIRKTNDPKEEIVKFEDLSDYTIGNSKGIADTFSAQSVASVSFSNDNKQIMMVGNDGIVIIRNLYLDRYASE